MFQPVRPVICFVNFCFSFTVKAKNLGKPVFILKQSVGRKMKVESLIQIEFWREEYIWEVAVNK